MKSERGWLGRVLLANAIVTDLCGVALLLLAGPLAYYFGVAGGAGVWGLRGLGAIFALLALLQWRSSRAPRPRAVWLLTAADAIYALSCAALLIAAPALTPAAFAAVLVTGLGVLGFALAQGGLLVRMSRGAA